MTPTIEEVKRVARECGLIASFAWYGTTTVLDTSEQLQAFAQHWIEVGRKMQRESDEALAMQDKFIGQGNDKIAIAISNNTGE